MKKLFLSLLLLVLATSHLPAQQRVIQIKNRGPKDSAQYYLSQSRSQKTGAYILLAGGLVASSLGALAIGMKDGLVGRASPEESSSSLRTGIALAGAGAAAITASIVLFNKAAKNKRKARLLLSDQPVVLTPAFHLSQPSVGLAIPLGK